MLTPEQAREQMTANASTCMGPTGDADRDRFIDRCLAYASDPEATQIKRVMADQGLAPTGNEHY